MKLWIEVRKRLSLLDLERGDRVTGVLSFKNVIVGDLKGKLFKN